jgi:hypothetical protein
MANLLAQAINSDDGDRAARIIRDALPKDWSTDREQRARYIGGWLKTEARYLA